MNYKALLLSLLICVNIYGQKKSSSFSAPPTWAKSAIWYELFVERFYNGDPSNDPQASDINIPAQAEAPHGWTTTSWTSDWYQQEPWSKQTGKPLPETITFRRYGGDLEGVLQKLDYLKDLGVNALYFRPLNDAPSLHKYDARSYHHIDVNFGPDPEGDKKIIAAEKPWDPSTWKWTSADKLFLKVIEEAHARGMKVVLDYSWNHTGIMFWAFQDILKNQEKAASKNWYAIKSFDNPATTENEFAYDGWLGIQSLPEIKKVDVTSPRVIGHPYEGDINPEAKKHIYDVTRRWLSPNGDRSKGIDGYRMDVADHIGLKFWREFRTVVRSIKSDAYIVGEIWWEKWPDELMNPKPYTSGDVFDAIMFYQIYRPARYFFAKTSFEINAAQFKDSLMFQWNRLSPQTNYAMMNVSSTADAPRLLSDFYNPGKYKFSAKPTDDPTYKTGKPDADTYRRLRLYLVHAFTNIGAPHIYNGEEMGMWGGDDPEDRKPLWWKEFSFDSETRTNYQATSKTYDSVEFNQEHFDFYRKLTSIRKNNPVLSSGKIKFLLSRDKMLGYSRFDSKSELLIFFNVDEKKQKYVLPSKAKYIDLLTNNEFSGGFFYLEGLSAVILKRP
jgi:cyclomaltodextrinase